MQLANRLSYWEYVSEDPRLYTAQVLREATVNVVRNGISVNEIRASIPFGGDVPVPNRRCLRYGPHGIHEYRGKFFPQLVRALINIAGVPANGNVADIMCGSGTTVVETVLIGCNGLGIDINPLSVLMSRTKCELLSTDHKSLSATYERVRASLLKLKSPRKRFDWVASLPSADQDYLKRWFSEQVLCDLENITAAILSVTNPTERNLLWLVQSNILRRVSWQKEDDLRVRREVRSDIENRIRSRNFLRSLVDRFELSLRCFFNAKESRWAEALSWKPTRACQPGLFEAGEKR